MLWSVCIYYECKSHAKRVWDLDSIFFSKQYSIFLYYTKSVPRTTAPKHIPAIPPIHQPTTLGTATSDTTFASRARVAVHLFEPFLKTFDRFCKKKFDGLMIYFSCKRKMHVKLIWMPPYLTPEVERNQMCVVFYFGKCFNTLIKFSSCDNHKAVDKVTRALDWCIAANEMGT